MMNNAGISFQQLLEDAPLGIIISNESGNIVLCNTMVEKMLGYEAGELIGVMIEELMPGRYANIHLEHRQNYMRNPRQRLMGQGLDLIACHKAGHEIPVEIALNYIRSEDNRSYVIAYIMDVTKRRNAEDALRKSEFFNRTIIESVEQGVVGYDRELRYTLWNSYMEELTGMSEEAVLGQEALKLFPHLKEGSEEFIYRALNGEIVRSEDMPYYIPGTDKKGWTAGLYSPHATPEGEIIGAIATLYDVTARRNMEDELRTQKRRNELILQTTMDGYALLDMDGNFKEVNLAFMNLIGYDKGDLLSMNINDLVYQEDTSGVQDCLQRVMETGSEHHEARYRCEDGRIVYLEASANFYPFEKDNFFFTFFRDVTERRMAEKELKHMALHDTLTGLPNRSYFYNSIKNAIERAFTREHGFAVLFIDLDGFKSVNDNMGHEKGDLLLKEVATRLQAIVRVNDVVARLGGDEFVILLEGVDKKEYVENIAQKVIDSLSQPVIFGTEDENALVTASVGISLYPENGNSSDELVNAADAAMYVAKQTGKNKLFFFPH